MFILYLKQNFFQEKIVEFESVIDVNVENNLIAPNAGRIIVAPT